MAHLFNPNDPAHCDQCFKTANALRGRKRVRCIIGEYCRRHGFVHGAEAEELRERLEALNDPRVNAILDDVDARDAAAYGEAIAKADR